MSLISIIIPVYNVEDYLEEAVISVCNQTYKKLEIILVDDGSTDNSSKICDELSLNDCRIKVIHKNNGGLKNLWGSLNDKTPLFIGEDGIKEWGSEIIQRGNAAAHGNSRGKEIDYNKKYIEDSIFYFLKFMQKANDVIRKDSILKDKIKKSLGLE